jgi:Uma2 family endonuclease
MSDMARIWETFEPPSGVRAEFIGGEIVLQVNPTTLHDMIVRNIVKQVDGRSLETWGERGVELHPESRPRPDVVVVRSEDISARWRDWPSGVLQAVIEVVSGGRDAWKDDWHRKRSADEEARIPRYLIVDPRDGTWHLLVLSYRQATPRFEEGAKGVFGHPVPLGISDEAGELVLDTSAWRPYPAREAR